MKRKLPVLLVLVLCLILAIQYTAIAADVDEPDAQFRIEGRNRTGQQVILNLVGLNRQGAYRLAIPPGADRSFTVNAGRYAQSTFACGETATGTLEVSHQLRLTFTPCTGAAPNAGAPTLEKVHLTDAPHGVKWFYRYGPAAYVFSGSGVGSCQFTADAEVTIYNRPDNAAQVFSVQPAGFTIQPSARTADRWLGFEPGIAQAANIGSFRLRWLAPGSGVLSGGCESLPVVWAPRPGICYDMPMFDTEVHISPDLSSAVVFVLHYGEFAQLLGLAPGGDWAKVDLGPGNTGSHAVGWVASSSLNVNGPCDGLPSISP